MAEVLKIRVARPVAAVHVAAPAGWSAAAPGERAGHEGTPASACEPSDGRRELEQQAQELARLCEVVNTLAARLGAFYEETIARSRSDIARLAVEIARKLLMHQVGRGDYDIAAIVEEALKQAPACEAITVRLNPEDLARCQQLQRENPGRPLAAIHLVADWSIARADCLVETPKGIVESVIEDHLERIGEALMRLE